MSQLPTSNFHLHVPLTIVMRSVMKPSLLSNTFRSGSACIRSTQRSLTTTHPPCSKQLPRAAIRSSFPRAQLQQTFRRSYADAIPPVTKRRGRGFLRWSWRAVYISALGGVGYMSYVIYMLRTPDEQFNPDPSKKTLVILGTLSYYRPVNQWHDVDRDQAPAGARFLF